MPLQDYEVVVGLEVHIQLLTRSKIFSPDGTAFGDAPNQHVSLITLAHPGTLPRLNEGVLELAARMGLACGSDISLRMSFDRKNYFYPDLPKGYQLTQQRQPIAIGGSVRIREGVDVRIHHIHLEEDAGKSVHDGHPSESGMDYNRAGTPLIELVTDPCIHSPEDAALFLAEIRSMVRFLGIGDGNMEEGSLRADANVSVRPKGHTGLGRKVEVKNMNSIRHLRAAVQHEYERQVACIEKGVEIISETRLFDADTGLTHAMRTKEELNDYRYFPDPDLSPVELSPAWLEEVRSRMPMLSSQYREKFRASYALPDYDAEVLSAEPDTAVFMDDLCQLVSDRKAASNWMMGPFRTWLNENPGNSFPLKTKQLASLIGTVTAGKISHNLAVKQVLPAMINDPDQAVDEVIKALGLGEQQSEDQLLELVAEVIRIYPLKVEEYRKGKKGILAMFMGEIMKRTGGKADPKRCTDLLRQALN